MRKVFNVFSGRWFLLWVIKINSYPGKFTQFGVKATRHQAAPQNHVFWTLSSSLFDTRKTEKRRRTDQSRQEIVKSNEPISDGAWQTLEGSLLCHGVRVNGR